jgi:NTP pyrophosphatase (non-canonical NTP hydrolase)
MTFDEYQRLAMRTHSDDRDRRLIYALGLTGEAGEVAEVLKKVHGHDHAFDADRLAKELGDVLWYLAGLAHVHGLSLDAIAAANIAKLRARYPEGFDTARSQNRAAGDL